MDDVYTGLNDVLYEFIPPVVVYENLLALAFSIS